jgi:AcrR family transcriptional regulator
MEALSRGPLPQSALIKIPRQPRSVAMVHDILDAAMQIIRVEGLASMSTNRVAERAGISIGSMYQYFANRETILAGLIERSLLDITQKMRQVYQIQRDEPLEQLLRNSFLMMLRYFEPYMEEMRRVVQEVPLLADNSAAQLMERTLMDIFRDYLLHNSARYRLKDGSAGLYVSINSMIFMYLKWLVQPSLLISEAQFVQAMERQTMSGIECLG